MAGAKPCCILGHECQVGDAPCSLAFWGCSTWEICFFFPPHVWSLSVPHMLQAGVSPGCLLGSKEGNSSYTSPPPAVGEEEGSAGCPHFFHCVFISQGKYVPPGLGELLTLLHEVFVLTFLPLRQ